MSRWGGSPRAVSAGVLMYRTTRSLEVLVAHPGGPYWRNRDNGVWSIPKGLLRPGEAPLSAARREFEEETGLLLPDNGFSPLGSVVLRSGKTVYAWSFEGDAEPEDLVSNTFKMEWPPGSGQEVEFPEMDRFMWADPDLAMIKLNKGQRAFITRLVADINT